MRLEKYVAVTFFCIVLLCAILGAGCTTSPIEVSGSPRVSTSPTTPMQTGEQSVRFSEAIAALNAQRSTGANASLPLHIRYIRAVDLQPQGSATEWTFGVTQGNESFFFVYTGKGGSRVAWPMKLSYHDINIDQIVTPDELLQSHKLFIQDITRNGTVPITELELVDGVYSLSIGSDANARFLRYDAITGKEIL
jgi:hypothetical protein